MCGIPAPTAINENFDKRLSPFVCRFEQSVPGLAAGYSLKFETEREMKHATWNGNRIGNSKPTPEQMRRQNGTSEGLPPA